MENRFTRQRYPKFLYQINYIFKGRIFQMLFPSQYCDCGLKVSWKFRYTNKAPPRVFFKKVPLSSYPPVGHTVDQNYRGIQQFRIRQTKRHKYLETFCRWVFLFLFFFFGQLSIIYSVRWLPRVFTNNPSYLAYDAEWNLVTLSLRFGSRNSPCKKAPLSSFIFWIKAVAMATSHP